MDDDLLQLQLQRLAKGKSRAPSLVAAFNYTYRAAPLGDCCCSASSEAEAAAAAALRTTGSGQGFWGGCVRVCPTYLPKPGSPRLSRPWSIVALQLRLSSSRLTPHPTPNSAHQAIMTSCVLNHRGVVCGVVLADENGERGLCKKASSSLRGVSWTPFIIMLASTIPTPSGMSSLRRGDRGE